MLIEIQRRTFFPATIGIMTVDGDFFGYTLELPWLDNRPRVSCIPPGSYELLVTRSFKFRRKLIEVLGVDGRAGIRIHGANRVEELRGCIAVSARRPTPYTLQGDLSKTLLAMVSKALANGELCELDVIAPKVAA